MSRLRAFWICLAAFVVLTLGVLLDPALGDIDEAFTRIHPKASWPSAVLWVREFELLGQRGPTLLVFAPVIVWIAWRRRDRTPVVALIVAEFVLNLGVGMIKYGLGRIGPFAAGDAHRFFDGGDIYPSGHVSNAVVLYGLLAWLAPPQWRRRAWAGTVTLSVLVGAGTVFLRTHWFTDVLGGWLAGALVLLALPSLLPTVLRWSFTITRRRAAERLRSPECGCRSPVSSGTGAGRGAWHRVAGETSPRHRPLRLGQHHRSGGEGRAGRIPRRRGGQRLGRPTRRDLHRR